MRLGLLQLIPAADRLGSAHMSSAVVQQWVLELCLE